MGCGAGGCARPRRSGATRAPSRWTRIRRDDGGPARPRGATHQVGRLRIGALPLLAALLVGALVMHAGCGLQRSTRPPGTSAGAGRPRKPPTLRGPRPTAVGVLSGNLPVPVAVIVENAPAARPQSGLDRAAVVWEILAEGGITRFFCIFTQPVAQIGPVRSTRIYFDQLDRAYALPLAHAGGNADALAAVHTWGLQNIDDIYGAGAYFWRSADRYAPDNLYTSTALLERAVSTFGYRGGPVAAPPQGPLPTGSAATSGVTLDYADDPPVYVYQAGWRWSAGAWVRTVNGQVQVMTDDNVVRAGTVFVLVVPYAPDPDPTTVGAIKMLWYDGGGPAWVLRDGRRVEGRWTMGGDGLPTASVDGNPDIAGPGPYWYEVVPTAADVSFS